MKTIRERRHAAGISQQRLAELAECSFSMVSLLDAGYEPAGGSVRDRVLDVLDELERERSSRFEGYDHTMTRLSKDIGDPQAA
jgi:predicted transcriptional regulator